MDFPAFTEFKPVERKKRDIREFSDKFTGRQSQTDNMKMADNPSHKEVMVKEYFNYLNINEQVSWNELKHKYSKGTENSLYLTGGSFISGCFYFLMTTPNTKSLGFQAVKSGVASILLGYGFYKYQQKVYYKELHNFYILTLDRVKDRRRRLLNQ